MRYPSFEAVLHARAALIAKDRRSAHLICYRCVHCDGGYHIGHEISAPVASGRGR